MSHLIKNPRITEKASSASDHNVYVFDIATNANKTEIKKAVTALYKVTPVKVNVTQVPKKSVTVKGRPGVKSGGKKAYVYLKKGDTIEFV